MPVIYLLPRHSAEQLSPMQILQGEIVPRTSEAPCSSTWKHFRVLEGRSTSDLGTVLNPPLRRLGCACGKNRQKPISFVHSSSPTCERKNMKSVAASVIKDRTSDGLRPPVSLFLQKKSSKVTILIGCLLYSILARVPMMCHRFRHLQASSGDRSCIESPAPQLFI